jgi:hypothetical protein
MNTNSAANSTSTNKRNNSKKFGLKDCVLIAIATGKRAGNLKEFRDNIINISTDCIYYHFWGGLLQPRFEEREYNNDFAGWARHALHDTILAEQLSMLDPTSSADLEILRLGILEYIENRLEESEYLQWARADNQFEFIRSQIVVFDTHTRVATPKELAETVPNMSPSSVFYHFIDARRRTPDRLDDFRAWLLGFGTEFEPLVARLAGIDPYYYTLSELRSELANAFQTYFQGSE